MTSLLKSIGEIMTVDLTKKDGPNLRYYTYSPKRLCVHVADTLWPEVTIPNTLANVKELERLGARKIKRPRAYRSPPPYYD